MVECHVADFSREAGEYLGDRHESITLTSARLEVEFRNGSKESTHLNLEHRAGTRNLIHSISLTTRRVRFIYPDGEGERRGGQHEQQGWLRLQVERGADKAGDHRSGARLELNLHSSAPMESCH